MATTPTRYEKDKNSQLDYTFSYTNFLQSGDSVSSAVVTDTPSSALTITSPSFNASAVTITISGGDEGITYDVVCRAWTENGEIVDQTLQLTVIQDPSDTHTFTVETGSGSATATSYVSLADANIYHASHLYNTDWTSATNDVREKALMWATRLLDENVYWHGIRTKQTQALSWPRYGVIDRDGYFFQNDEIPSFLKNATAELARHLIISNRTAEVDTETYKKVVVGSIEIEFNQAASVDVLPDSVKKIVKYYGVVGSGTAIRKLVRV